MMSGTDKSGTHVGVVDFYARTAEESDDIEVVRLFEILLQEFGVEPDWIGAPAASPIDDDSPPSSSSESSRRNRLKKRNKKRYEGEGKTDWVFKKRYGGEGEGKIYKGLEKRYESGDKVYKGLKKRSPREKEADDESPVPTDAPTVDKPEDWPA